jgi:predicted Ser/Thr protein kinase
MGAVYLGREVALDREVAIKTLAPDVAGAPDLRERFRREARIAAKLTHPNIVPLYTFGETRDVIYYVMGFVRGESLAERLGRVGRIQPDESRRILGELADALAYAHERGIVHRDIKPENVLIEDATGRVLLTDFGIARMAGGTSLTQAGGLIGTPQYMSPEQARGDDVGPPSDVYSLGVLGYRMLAGSLPVRSDSIPDLVAKLASPDGPTIEAPPSEVPTFLADAVMRCLRKDPGERSSAARLREELGKPDDASSIPPLHQIEGRAFYVFPMVLLGLLLGIFEIFLWDAVTPTWRIMIQLMQAAGGMAFLSIFIGFEEGRKAGVPVRGAIAVMLREPRWFVGWVPRWARDPGDVWERLPKPLRLYRILWSLGGVLFLVVLVLLPFGLLSFTVIAEKSMALPRTLVIASSFLIGIVSVAVALAMAYADEFLKKHAVNSGDRSRLLSTSFVTRGVWADPRMAELLSPERNSDPVASPTTPSQLGERIIIKARKLPAPAAAGVVDLERRLAGGILQIETDIRKVEALLDPEEGDRLDRRLSKLGGSDAPEEVEIRRVLLEQRRLMTDLLARREALSIRREAWMIRLRALDASLARSQSFEVERQARAITEFLATEGRQTELDVATAIQRT